MKPQRPQIAKLILRKKIKAGGIVIPHFRLQSYSHQNIMVLAWKWTHRLMKQDREPRNKPTDIWSINLWQRWQNIWGGKDSLLNKWCWKNWPATCKRMKLEHFLTPYTKINSKWIQDLNVRPETIKLLDVNVGSVLFDIRLINIFWICILRQG